MNNESRKLLGTAAFLGWRERIYQIADGFEVETREGYDIVQRRVLFDDVQLVTLHRRLGWLYLSLTGCTTLFFGVIAISIVSYNALNWQPAAVFAGIAAPFLILFLVRLLLGQEVITIFGRRSRAQLHFSRRSRAREIYGKVCAAVREAQRVASVPESPMGNGTDRTNGTDVVTSPESPEPPPPHSPPVQ